MNDVYDIIDTLRRHKYLSVRKLAELAGINPSSLATIMARRPKTISRKNLEAIGGVLGAKWYALVNAPECAYAADAKIPAALSEENVKMILRNFLGNEEGMYSKRFESEEEQTTGLPEEQENTGSDAAFLSSQYSKENEDQFAHDLQYKRSIICMLERLNTEGLLEAMHQVVAIARNPDLCK